MDQAEFELQLKVWKDLAISKQMLIDAATDALKLSADCTTDELREALDNAIKRSIEADNRVAAAEEQAKVAVSALEKKMAESEKAQAYAEEEKSKALEELEATKQAMTAARTANAEEVKKAKAQVTEKEKAIKTIKNALGDSPENVVKKLKTLKKQKTDEATARKRAEDDARSLRKEKQQLELQVKELKELLGNSGKLVEQYRELHQLCIDMHGQLKPLVDDAKSLPDVPAMDVPMLDAIEAASAEAKE